MKIKKIRQKSTGTDYIEMDIGTDADNVDITLENGETATLQSLIDTKQIGATFWKEDLPEDIVE